MAAGWLEAPAPGVSSPGAARDELGAPRIVTGAEAADAMGRLGFNVENMTSMLPTMNNIVNSTTSLIDNAYSRQLAYRKSLADLGETAARTGLYGAQAANIQSESDQRQQLLPLDIQAKQLALRTNKLNLDAVESQQADTSDALNRSREAISALPEWNDPDYRTKINAWLDKNAYLLSRPDAVGKQLQTAYGLVDGRVKATSDFQQKLGQVQEFNQLQQGGYIQSPANADQLVFSGQADPLLVHGRMAKNLDQLQQLIADPRTPQAQKDQLSNLYNYGKSFLASDTGASDVMANKAHELFNTNGNFNATAQGLINGVSATLPKETKPAEYEATVAIPGLPNIKPGEAPTMRVKGTQEQVQGALTPYEQKAQRETTLNAIRKAGIPDTPENRTDQAAYQRGEISAEELAARINARAAPPAAVAPNQKPKPGTTPTLPVQPNQQQPRVPANYRGMPLSQAEPIQPDTSGSRRLNAIYNNPGALGLSDLGRRFGATASGKYDTGHPFAQFPTKEAGAAAQFALWENKEHYLGHTLKDAITNWIGPGEHGEAEYISQRTGIPLDQTITDDFLRSPDGIRLMQAQAEYEGQNVLTAEQWKRGQDWAYKGIEPGTNLAQAGRERGAQVTTAAANAPAQQRRAEAAPRPAAALAQAPPARLTPLTPVQFRPTEPEGEIAQYLPNHVLPRPASIAEARALPPGTHFLDPDGNRRMVA